MLADTMESSGVVLATHSFSFNVGRFIQMKIVKIKSVACQVIALVVWMIDQSSGYTLYESMYEIGCLLKIKRGNHFCMKIIFEV